MALATPAGVTVRVLTPVAAIALAAPTPVGDTAPVLQAAIREAGVARPTPPVGEEEEVPARRVRLVAAPVLTTSK